MKPISLTLTLQQRYVIDDEDTLDSLADDYGIDDDDVLAAVQNQDWEFLLDNEIISQWSELGDPVFVDVEIS